MANKIWHKELSVHQNYRIGENCTIHAPVWIGEKVRICDRVKIEPFVFIPDGITIEDDVFIGPGTVFCNDKYPPSYGEDRRETIVAKGASIGANCTILPGITIGFGARIGAGSVVTKDVPSDETWCGNPAKKIKHKKL